MGLTSISIRNFQSIKKADLELGSFTVIVGPSSSGKSALIRAFKALASNVRGNGVITRGQKQMLISVRTDTHLVTLERNERQGLYRVAGPDGEQTFTKLAGDVPDLVSRALRIDPITNADSVNFAAQFDKPYLLDESGAVVARQLGELTNVNVIFEAVRQANKVRSQAASTLKTRKGDLEAVRSRVAQYQDLPERLQLMAQAEAVDASRRTLNAQLSSITRAVQVLRVAEEVAARHDLPPVPDTSTFEALSGRLQSLHGAVTRLKGVQEDLMVTWRALAAAERAAAKAEDEFQTALNRAGVCPTCGQRTAQ